MHTRILAVDPGYKTSAAIWFDGVSVVNFGAEIPNEELEARLMQDFAKSTQIDVLVVEQVSMGGMIAGIETFDTCLYAGILCGLWKGQGLRYELVKRATVKMHLCGSMRAKDGNVRQALIDRFGPDKARAIGTKKAPGVLYGVSSHAWAALAVGVTYFDRVQAQDARIEAAVRSLVEF